jgi:starvation-inducible DNA-binding protein
VKPQDQKIKLDTGLAELGKEKMEELIARMNKVLADSYMFTIKSEFCHWNVEGENFPQYHEFFGNLYEEVYSSIDVIAEFIRTLDGNPQNAPSMIKQNSTITELTTVKSSYDMLEDLSNDTQLVIKDLFAAMDMADKFRKVGLSNYLQERIAAFEKHAWMIKSTNKR